MSFFSKQRTLSTFLIKSGLASGLILTAGVSAYGYPSSIGHDQETVIDSQNVSGSLKQDHKSVDPRYHKHPNHNAGARSDRSPRIREGMAEE